MHLRTLILTSALILAGSRPVPAQAGPADAVRRFVTAFNAGDVPAAASTCAEQTSIIDEFAPHEWHGPDACTRWMSDYDADAKRNGITDGVVTLGRPRHVDVAGDQAYVVMPASYVYRKRGARVREIGSTLTASLVRAGGTWRMTGWAWAKR